MATSKKLKAWVRYDGQKKIVPGSLILQANKPKVGTWVEVSTDLCCDNINPGIPVPIPVYLYTVTLECSNYCPANIIVDGIEVELSCIGTDFNALVTALQTQFPTAIIQGIPGPGTPTISIVSATQVFGDISIEECGTISPTIVALPALRLLINIEVFKKFTECSSNPFNNVAAWNTFFDLPVNGTPFTSVTLLYSPGYVEVLLFGATNITLKDDLFSSENSCHLPLVRILDDAACVTVCGNRVFNKNDQLVQAVLPVCTSVGNSCFNECRGMLACNIPNLITAGEQAFQGCIAMTVFSFPLATTIGILCFNKCEGSQIFNLPSATTIGDNAFEGCIVSATFNLNSCTALGSTVGDNNVFASISGNNITLTVPSALMTADAGSPDGDIVYLQANNTVIVITV